MLNRFWEKNVTVLQSSFIAEKTLDYRQEIIRGPIMMIFWFVFAALKLYCMLGVSAQSTRLHISVHKYLFSFESGYFSVFKNIIVVPFCLKTSIFFICTGYPWIVLKLFLPYSEKKKKRRFCWQILSHPSTFSGTHFGTLGLNHLEPLSRG